MSDRIFSDSRSTGTTRPLLTSVCIFFRTSRTRGTIQFSFVANGTYHFQVKGTGGRGDISYQEFIKYLGIGEEDLEAESPGPTPTHSSRLVRVESGERRRDFDGETGDDDGPRGAGPEARELSEISRPSALRLSLAMWSR